MYIVYATHCRVKQRSDKTESKFLVPRDGDVNYAAVVEDYLCTIKNTLGVFKGRLFYTVTPDKFVQTLVGLQKCQKKGWVCQRLELLFESN